MYAKRVNTTLLLALLVNRLCSNGSILSAI